MKWAFLIRQSEGANYYERCDHHPYQARYDLCGEIRADTSAQAQIARVMLLTGKCNFHHACMLSHGIKCLGLMVSQRTIMDVGTLEFSWHPSKLGFQPGKEATHGVSSQKDRTGLE